MTWKATTQNRVLAAVERGNRKPKEIASAAGVDIALISIYLRRLDTQKKIRMDGDDWVPYKTGLALVDAWK